MPLETTPITADPRISTRYPDNPSDVADHAKMKHEDGPFFYCHTNIAEFNPGNVISAKELPPGAQIERLLKLGAITVASAEHEEAYKLHLEGLPPKAKGTDEVASTTFKDASGKDVVVGGKDSSAATESIPNSTQKVEPLIKPNGGGLSGPPKAG